MFTDKDWSRLEEWLAENKMASRATVMDLMRRAKAAEEVLNNLRGHDAETVDEDLMVRWRKVAGK